MKLSLKVISPESNLKSTLIMGVYENGELSPSATLLDKSNKGYITNLLKMNKNAGKIGSFTPIFQMPGMQSECVLLVGCGKFNELKMAGFRKIIYQTIRYLTNFSYSKVTIFLSDLTVTNKNTPWKIKQMAETINEGMYKFDLFKSKKEPSLVLNECVIAISADAKISECQDALEQGQAIGLGMTLTKNLANTPSNICTPTFLADQAKQLARDYKSITTKIIDEKEMQKLGMGAILGVSQGSAEEAKLICLQYFGRDKKEAPIGLIGKGITFDTGGISLKSPDGMVGMKYDMCGAATVLGTIQAAAELALPINIVGIIAAVENMPGGTAYKPEDILTSMSGQTIEVISTDAEGRLVLADALTYCEQFAPSEVIDIATLTGAVVIALGFHTSGLLSNNDEFAKELMQAGEESNDRAWQLPLYDEYQEQIKSPFADMANTGGRAAGVITAACFLSRFAKKFKWAHLDVAGTAAMMSGTSERMATGRPVPLLMQHLINRSKVAKRK